MMRGIIIPSNWLKEQRAVVDVRTADIMWKGFEWPKIFTRNNICSSIKKSLQQTSIEQAVIVLPVHMECMTKLRHWPDLYIEVNQRIVILSLLFAHDLKEVNARVDEFLLGNKKKHDRIHFSCQYQPPYTDMLDNWKEAGVTSYHPGDYFKK